MKILALVLATLYLHQFIGGWSECLIGFLFGAFLAENWRDCSLGAVEVGSGWLVTAFIFDQLSSGRVDKIGSIFNLNSVEATYALTFFIGFSAFLCWSLFGLQIKRALDDSESKSPKSLQTEGHQN